MSAARRCRRRAICVASAGVLLLSTLDPATAAPMAEPQAIDVQAIADDIPLHNHTLGSQIARVEGEKSTPDSTAAAQRPHAFPGPGIVEIHAPVAAFTTHSNHS